jgi:ABC-type branched-subunit amino acid transport system substrate-binding protein
MYELVTGQQAFAGASTMAVLMAVATRVPRRPAELFTDVPLALSDLIMRLMAKNPNERPASAREVADALASIAAAAGIDCQTPSSGISKTSYFAPKPPTRPRPVGLIIGSAAIVILLALIAWQLFGRGHSNTHGPASRSTAQGVTDTEIVLGMSGPFTGVSKELGREMEIGLETYFRSLNELGGVNGRRIRLIPLDDRYEPQLALTNMKTLNEKDNVFAVIGNIGTPTALVTIPYATENKMLFFGAFTGAKLLREDPPNRYVFNYRASYVQETAEICKYLLKVQNIKPNEIAVFSQNDPYGDAGFEGVRKELRPLVKDVKDIVHVRYTRSPTTVNVSEAVAEIQRHPEIRAVVMVPTYEPAAVFIKKLKDAKRDLIFANVSFVGSEALRDRLMSFGPKYADGVIVTQVVPPIDSSATIVLRYKEQLRRHFRNEPASFTALEGYIAAALFVEGVKRTGDELTTENLIEKLETITDLDIGTGAKLTFNLTRHQASNRVWGTIIDKEGRFQVLDLD